MQGSKTNDQNEPSSHNPNSGDKYDLDTGTYQPKSYGGAGHRPHEPVLSLGLTPHHGA